MKHPPTKMLVHSAVCTSAGPVFCSNSSETLMYMGERYCDSRSRQNGTAACSTDTWLGHTNKQQRLNEEMLSGKAQDKRHADMSKGLEK